MQIGLKKTQPTTRANKNCYTTFRWWHTAHYPTYVAISIDSNGHMIFKMIRLRQRLVTWISIFSICHRLSFRQTAKHTTPIRSTIDRRFSENLFSMFPLFSTKSLTYEHFCDFIMFSKVSIYPAQYVNDDTLSIQDICLSRYIDCARRLLGMCCLLSLEGVTEGHTG